MDLLLLIGIAAIGLALLLVLALGVAAKRADGGDDVGWLSTLVTLRSPTGRPFFANRKAMREFVETLDEVEQEPPPKP